MNHRWATAAVLIALFLVLLFAVPSAWFLVPIVPFLFVSLHEAFLISGIKQSWSSEMILQLVALTLAHSFARGTQAFQVSLVAWILVLLIGTLHSVRGMELERACKRAMLRFFWVIYLAIFFGALLVLERLENGKWAVLLIIAAIAAGDTAAYFCGRKWGTKRLSPIVSPNKTRVGAFGHLAGTLVILLLFLPRLNPAAAVVNVILVAALVSGASQLGDLGESLFKRITGNKDSGRILPGHGGLLDRIDGHLLGVPVFWALKGWLW